MEKEPFKAKMSALRESLKGMCGEVAEIKGALLPADPATFTDKGEVIANIMLAFRHLEDAAMRFGKAIQAADGGVSPLGGPNTPTQQ